MPTEQYNAEFGGESLKPDDFSDMGQAKVLVRKYGDELKFTDATDFCTNFGRRGIIPDRGGIRLCYLQPCAHTQL